MKLATQLNESGLDYKPLPISELFANNQYYIVPKYQRNFAWTDEEVSELMSDLIEAWQDFPEERYLLGQIIVCPAKEKLENQNKLNQWDLIDGQQRCTTLYILTLIAAKYLQNNLPESPQRALKNFVNEQNTRLSIIDTIDENIEYPRIRAAADGELFLTKLVMDEALPSSLSPTQTNITNAKTEIEEALNKIKVPEGQTLYDEIKSFLEFISTNVYVVRLALLDTGQAMRVFQKVNNRGLELDSADLIKNFLFQKVTNDRQFSELAQLWEKATKELYKSRLKRVKSMEFLMKALIGIQTGESISTGNLYTEWSRLLKSSESAIYLAEKLPESASKLQRICSGQLPQTAHDTDLAMGIYMQKAVQPLEILLAGAHLHEDSYKVLLKMVEDRTMLSTWATEPSQTFERIVHPWAHKVSKLDSNPTIEEIRATASNVFLDLDFPELESRAFRGIQKLDYNIGAQKDRIRYVFARVNKIVQAELHVMEPSLKDLMKTSYKEQRGFDLDHIFPKSGRHEEAWVQNRDLDETLGNSSRYQKKIHSIGNLTLLHPRDNREQSDSLPWESDKAGNFETSELLANRLLAVASQTQKWGEEEIDNRALYYWQIILKEIKENLGIQDN
jgi:uncharacterized protein with ParB-like and HNH nuclease domain